MLDRGEVTLHLWQAELELQVTKIKLVEVLLEVYEHTCDPLEAVRVLQIVADTMAVRPRVNLEATYFRDSYTAEIEVLKQRWHLYSEVVELQRATERAENDEVRKFQELKMRKLMQFVNGDWVYRPDGQRVPRMGAAEELARSQGHEQAREGKRAQQMKEVQKQRALKEIAERHITEFAGDQHTDFAHVLGLPEVTASDLFKKQGQMDPLVIDAVREHSHFSKQIEGYPWFYPRMEGLAPQSTGLHTPGAGLTDFYESLCSITRVHAACEQAFAELSSTHRPENGVAASCLESALLLEARGCLKVLRGQQDESAASSCKALGHLEEDFYLSSSDKLIFLMREFKAELHPDRISTSANPLLVAKLAVQEVGKFDFPRLKAADVAGYADLSDEELTEKMITLAKVSVTRKYGDEEPRVGLGAGSALRDSDDEAAKAKQVRSPSLLQLACNTVEALRLR
jgi:hypothetical protein